MSTGKILTAVFCAAALALAACGGGGGVSVNVSVDRAKDQRAAIDRAIKAAETAVETLGEGSDEAALAAAKEAVSDAKGAVTAASALSTAEKDAYGTAIRAIERSLDAAEVIVEAALAMAAERLSMALEGSRISGISAAVTHAAAPVMSGTVPGNPATPVLGLETAAVRDSASTVDGWRRGRYTGSDESAGISDTVVLFTNIEAPGAQPFSGEGGRYGTANGLDADGNLPIVGTTDATLIASSAFPTGVGIREHTAGPGGTVEVAGSFDGASGTYVCTPMSGSACTSAVRSGGGTRLSGGWKFVPAQGAQVPTPDDEYQYFGWWLRKAEGGWALGVFHDGVGSAADEFADLVALEGTATYRGPAAGHFALGGQTAGEFTATATLEVDFGDDAGPGTVEGTVDGFTVGGKEMPWSVELQAAAISPGGAIAAGGNATALTYWTIDENRGASAATWSGRFHDANEDQVPAVATGMFEAVHGDSGRMSGAFGTTLQP